MDDAIERAAQQIYEHPDFDKHFPEKKPAWVPGGNSRAQDIARVYANLALGNEPKSVTVSMNKNFAHIARVAELLTQFAAELVRRAGVHDRSKFDPEELIPLSRMDELIAREGNVPFGSPAYEERKKLLGPMLERHYRLNTHHPEHYMLMYGGNHEIGVEGMDLFDLVEMVVDWKAASERGEAPSMGLKAGCEKYKISLQLEQIMRNTVDRLGWKADE